MVTNDPQREVRSKRYVHVSMLLYEYHKLISSKEWLFVKCVIIYNMRTVHSSCDMPGGDMRYSISAVWVY